MFELSEGAVMNNIKIIYNSLISVLFTIQHAAMLFGCEVSCSGLPPFVSRNNSTENHKSRTR